MRVQTLSKVLLLFLAILGSVTSCKKAQDSNQELVINKGEISASAQTPTALSHLILEAENATFSGGNGLPILNTAPAIAGDANRSGGYYVEQNEGNLSFEVNIPSDEYYNIYINAASPGGDKVNTLAIDGVSTNFTLKTDPAYTELKVVTTFKLTAGVHTIAVNKVYGYIQIDFLRLEAADASSRFNINRELVTPGASIEAKNVYGFLRKNYGSKILSGVMTLNSFDETNWLKENTGKEPAILGVDFMNVNRGYTWYDDKTSPRDAKIWWDRNGIPTLLWHWRDPSRLTEAFYSNQCIFDVSKIFSPESPEYIAMIKDIDYVSGLLKELQAQNVPIIWRPLHEAAGTWFWWGAKGPEPCKKLYQIMYDRMVNYHGLKNLIWVWTREPNDEAWYPGDAYVDIVGRDIYKTGDHTSQSIEFNNMNALYGGKKMVTISECGANPDPDSLVKDGAKWSWFMTWYGDYTRTSTNNSVDLWKKIMAHPYVITLDEMPSLK